MRQSLPSPDLLLVINGDLALDFDLSRMIEYHRRKRADITLFTHPNQHPFDSALIDTDEDGRVVRWLNREEDRGGAPNRVNAGIHLIRRSALDFSAPVWQKQRVDLDRDVLKPALASRRVYAYDSHEYVKDMGTPERVRLVEEDIRAGLVRARNLRLPQRAVFLDRDGTINRRDGYISSPERMVLLPGVAEAVRRLNRSPYLALVVSNQPVIARGECTFADMQRIHGRMEDLLGREGAFLDGISFCPHHPDSGFPGEVRALKTDCLCRKPRPGMLLNWAERWNIDLSSSWMVGDSVRDVEAGRSAGCRTIRLTNDITRLSGDRDWTDHADFYAPDLLSAVELILGEKS